MKKPIYCIIIIAMAVFSSVNALGQILITQYYEGDSGTNRWVEMFNYSSETIDLAAEGFFLGSWANASTEGYKSDIAPSNALALTGSLDPGETLLLANNATDTPSYATPDITAGSVLNFNGDDSIAIYTGATFATANIIDAIGFTDDGNEGANISYIRTSAEAGFDTTAGSQAGNFAAIWNAVSLESVNNAAIGTDSRLGETTLAVIPEPATYTLALGIIAIGFALNRARQRRFI